MSNQKSDTGNISRVLVTGATGYVGGRLAPRLLEHGYNVRVMIRGDASRLASRPWQEDVEIVSGDVLEPDTLPSAVQDVDAAYYLIHSMGSHGEFSERDITAARNFASACAAAGVQRIIYLGGLGDPDSNLSEHLRSRQETGDALREFDVPVTEFRAGMVVGAGSISFEMLRNLTERLPIMIAPRWVYTKTQPIAIRDVLNYFIAALETPASAGETIEIGSPDVLSYAQMMQTYARIRGLKRIIFRVPLLTPRLSSYWVHWFTPISASIATPLIEGLRNELIVQDGAAQAMFETIEPLGFEDAVRQALERTTQGDVETVWSDALASSQGDTEPVLFTQEQGLLIERREKQVAAPPAAVFRAFTSLGGAHGWPPSTWLWQLRGALDRLIGGVGMRRARRHPQQLRQGEALDFWRVERIEQNKLLRLRAEMKLPGQGWLQFEAVPGDGDLTTLRQTAYLAPKGLAGQLYWYLVYPLHGFVFSRMIEHVAAEAVKLSRQNEQPVQTPAPHT